MTETQYIVTIRDYTGLAQAETFGEVLARVGLVRYLIRVASHRVRDLVRESGVEQIEPATARDEIWAMHWDITKRLREMKACLSRMNLTEDERDSLVDRLYFAEGVVLDIASTARIFEAQKS